MRLFKTLALTGILAVAGTACAELEVTKLTCDTVVQAHTRHVFDRG